MRHFSNLRDAFEVFKAAGSPVRLEILEQILNNTAINIDTLAKNLHLTNGALTKHITMLEKVGLIKVEEVKGKRGMMKLCTIKEDKILVEITSETLTSDQTAAAEIPLGLYSDFKVTSPCGLASEKNIIGTRNEPSSFLSPFRGDAGLIWLKKGSLTYLLPPIKSPEKATEYRFTFEVSSDIYGEQKQKTSVLNLFLDNYDIGKITINCPTEKRRGFLTPTFWESFLPQYGNLRTVRITDKGTFFEGEKISGTTISLISTPKTISFNTSEGFTLFGRGFGDYNHSIIFGQN